MAGGSPSSVASFNAPLPASPSMVSNNLCCLSSHVAYASAGDVLLTPLKSFMARKHEPTSLKMTHKVTNTHNNNADTGVRIQGVTTVRIGTDQHLVVLGTDGVRIFDGKTATRLEFSMPTPKDNDLFAARTRPSEKYADRGAYCSCACSARSDDGRTQVVIGTSAGALLIVSVDGTRFSHANTIVAGEAHAEAVSSLASDAVAAAAGDPRREVASCSVDGEVVVWSPRSYHHYEALWRLPNKSSPCASVGVRGAQLFLAHRDGRLCVYDTVSRELTHEIVAHSRLLSTMALHPTQPYVATAAHDTTLAVWRIDNANASCELSAKWPTGLLTGVTFVDETATVAVSAYDASELRVYSP